MISFNNYNKIYTLIFISIVLHIIFINFYPVNFEYVFYEGNNFIREKFNKNIAIDFFNQQANTFFFTLILSFFSFIFPFIDNIIIGKLISLSSYLFIGLAIKNFYLLKKNNNKNNKSFIVLILLLVNPLIWVFGYRSTPDLISMSLALFGFSLLFKSINYNNYLKSNIKSVIIISIATTIKPIVGIYFLLSICFLKLSFNKKSFKDLIIIGICYSIIPGIYFLTVYFNFGFFLFTDYYMEVLSVVNTYLKYFSNLVLYTSFLLIFLTPIIIGRLFYLLFEMSFKFKIFNIFVLIIIYFFSNQYLLLSVEMSFGIFDKIINIISLKGIFGMFSYLFFLITFLEFKKGLKNLDYTKLKLIFIGFLYLIIVSSSLASQRYLIVILPVFYFIFGDYYKSKINLVIVFCLCLPTNIILIGNQYLTGKLSHKIIQKINNKGLIEDVCVGAVGSHVSHYFNNSDRLAKNCVLKDLHIVNGVNSKALISVEDNFLFINKSYSLIKVR